MFSFLELFDSARAVLEAARSDDMPTRLLGWLFIACAAYPVIKTLLKHKDKFLPFLRRAYIWLRELGIRNTQKRLLVAYAVIASLSIIILTKGVRFTRDDNYAKAPENSDKLCELVIGARNSYNINDPIQQNELHKALNQALTFAVQQRVLVDKERAQASIKLWEEGERPKALEIFIAAFRCD
jgi:hypothetical protein